MTRDKSSKFRMMKPPISRMGGKSKLRKTIIEIIPDHVCYVEPFFGAGWVFFGKAPSKVEVINDVDKELINLFKTIKYHVPETERTLEYELSGRDIFKEYKNVTLEHSTEIQRAVRFLCPISQSLTGKGNHYGYGANTKPSPQIFYKGVLGNIKNRPKNTYVENLSFEKIIEKYDREYSLSFCDPPYFETAGYGTEFGEKEHLLLRDKLKNIKGKFLATINDHPKVREWYKDFNTREVKVMYSVSNQVSARKEYGELIITSF